MSRGNRRAPDELLGELALGRYRIVQPLGRGGMGVVYLGRTEGAAGFTRPVVVKRALPDVAAVERGALFVREARILSNLTHPNIVGVVDFGQEHDAYVMVLDYVHGYHVGQWLHYIRDIGQLFSVEFAIHIMIDVLDALHYAHTLCRNDGAPLQIVHRDISPENLLLDVQGHVRVADFGIARMAGDAGVYRTSEGEFKGKLPFAAPELYTGDPPTPSSDIYASAVVLYQLLTGTNPFRGSGTAETLHRVLTHVPESISRFRSDVPDVLDKILARALAKSAKERYESAFEFAAALRALRSQSENQTFSELAAAISRDFLGDMPARLQLESLQSRDAAWRNAQTVPKRAQRPLSSSPPRLGPDDDATAVMQTPPGQVTTVPETPRTKPRDARRAALVVVGSALAAAAAAALVMLLLRPESAGGPRFLVVEQTSREAGSAEPAAAAPLAHEASAADDHAGAAASAGAAATPDAEPQSSAAAAKASAPATPAGKGADPALLSRTFARRQARIESCFQEHASDVSGQPQISVRFQIDRSGAVTSANLVPPALQGTPLGRCVLEVARATHFGAQPEPLTFTIPITARRLR